MIYVNYLTNIIVFKNHFLVRNQKIIMRFQQCVPIFIVSTTRFVIEKRLDFFCHFVGNFLSFRRNQVSYGMTKKSVRIRPIRLIRSSIVSHFSKTEMTLFYEPALALSISVSKTDFVSGCN
jgi:hypothetical protein